MCLRVLPIVYWQRSEIASADRILVFGNERLIYFADCSVSELPLRASERVPAAAYLVTVPRNCTALEKEEKKRKERNAKKGIAWKRAKKMKKKVHGRLLLRYYVLYVYHCTCGRLLWILYRYIIRGSCVLLLLLLLMATDVPVISVRDSAWPRNNFSPVRSLSLPLSSVQRSRFNFALSRHPREENWICSRSFLGYTSALRVYEHDEDEDYRMKPVRELVRTTFSSLSHAPLADIGSGRTDTSPSSPS